MVNVFDHVYDLLKKLAKESAKNALVPYSNKPVAAVLLLSNGSWIPGVRVESASFSLTIPAIVNAFSTAVALGRHDVVAAVFNLPVGGASRAFLSCTVAGNFKKIREDFFVLRVDEALPTPTERLSPFLSTLSTQDDELSLVRQIATRAYTPASNFPVGALLINGDGKAIPGVNVEHNDWSFVLCAERNALGTANSYGVNNLSHMILTCLQDARGTPCGACRQLLAEQLFNGFLLLDRHDQPPERTTPTALIPGFFNGAAIPTASNVSEDSMLK